MARPVRFNVHPIQADIKDNISLVNMPEGHMGEGFFTTRLSSVVGLARKNSLWPLPFATSCCGIEFMAVMASHYDLARFGAERLAFTPRQCDLLMVMGTIAKKMGPIVKQVYLQMAEPRWVMAVGRLREQRRYFRYLFGAAGDRPGGAGGCLCTRLSAPAGSDPGRVYEDPGPGRAGECAAARGEQYKALLNSYGIQ
jgi:hypothetical protein